MKKVSKLDYKKYVKALKKAKTEQAEEDKLRWRNCVEDFDSIQGLSPIQKAETWLKKVLTVDKLIEGGEYWIKDLAENEFGDQEALIYLISRGVDCSEQIKNMSRRLKVHKKKSESFWRFVETRSDNEVRFLGLQRRQIRKRKADKDSSHFENLARSHFSLANDDESYQVASMVRTLEWCDIGGYDLVWKEYVNRLNEDVTRGGEIDQEIASQTLFNICRSDFAIELMADNLVKLLDIIEMPDYQLTVPWHRWNHDDMSLLADIKTNSIFAYAASIAFAEKRLRQYRPNKKLVDEAIKWLIESQEESGAWKISTLLDEPSIMGTCMVVHALAINRPRGWKLAASHACDWLLTKQDDFGFWYESPFPPTDPVYLTVLVLDTLELIKEDFRLTFDVNKNFAHFEKQDDSKAISQTFYVNGELVMGDKYNVGNNIGGIQNVGKFKNSSSKIIHTNNEELTDKLMVLLDAITKSQHLSEKEKDEQIEILNQLRDEINKPEPDKTMLKMLGNGLLKTLQVVPDLVKAVTAIAPYLPK